jgi:alpha-glucosidase
MSDVSWWQRGVVYHIYPRSFQDSNGDGVGDLPGITRRLGYLSELGVDALWLSPIYPSPMADFGYDVSDYTAVHSLFGTLADFDTLLRAAHERGLKVLLDWVPNHTSDEHPWFQESRSSRDNPKRDWYFWRDARPDGVPSAICRKAKGPMGGPPNNWVSEFGGSAWQWDERTSQYYLHTYDVKQPDLNWRNPAVQAAVLDVLRFWLDRGVDGFRVDALRQVVKDEALPDNPANPAYQPEENEYYKLLPLYSSDQPEVHDIVRLVRAITDRYGDIPLIGELYLPIDRLVAYYGADGAGVHLPTNFHLIMTPWNARQIGRLIDVYEAALPAYGWPNWVLSNHDRSRVASRVGAAQARVAAMLLLTLRGTPTIYYGDELGMHDVPISVEAARDPWGKHMPGHGFGRDPERTPMQWDAGPGAGFTTGTPWLPLAEDYRGANVDAEAADPHSMLGLYRRLIAVRRVEPALSVGPYRPVAVTDAALAYLREDGRRRFLVALNFSHESVVLADELPEGWRGQVVISTHLDRDQAPASGALDLRADEGLLIELEGRAHGEAHPG